jgi:hypothetical protein
MNGDTNRRIRFGSSDSFCSHEYLILGFFTRIRLTLLNNPAHDMKKLFFLLAALGSLTTTQGQIFFYANLADLQNPNGTAIFGSAEGSLTGTTFSFSGSYNNLQGGAIGVSLLEDGATIYAVSPDPLASTTGTFSGSIALAPIYITELESGMLDFNVRTESFRVYGELQGQILETPEPTTVRLAALGLLVLLAIRRQTVRIRFVSRLPLALRPALYSLIVCSRSR